MAETEPTCRPLEGLRPMGAEEKGMFAEDEALLEEPSEVSTGLGKVDTATGQLASSGRPLALRGDGPCLFPQLWLREQQAP